jgi:hypothetical protein
MLIRVLISMMLLALNGLSSASADTKLDLKQFPSSMSFSRYETDDFNTMNRLLYDADQGQYIPQNRMTRHTLATRCVAEYLRGQQTFSLTEMMKRLGYTPETVQEQSAIGVSLQHEQVIFLETTRSVPHRQWDGGYGNGIIDEISHDDDNHSTVRVKTSSIWTVSGQTLSHESPFIIPAKLPWESEPSLAGIAEKYFDRNKYKFVSEWGRGAQILPGEIDALYSAAAATDYQRVKAMGGKIEDAWVVIDPATPENTRLYRRWFPDSQFPPGLDPSEYDKGQTLFLVPLAEVMKKFPPRKYLQRVSKVIELSGGKLSDAEALDLLSEYRLISWDELNFRSPHNGDQKQPLLLHDFSMGAFYSQFGVFERFGIPQENFEALGIYLQQFRKQFGTNDIGQYPDASDMNFYPQLVDSKAIEVSNLNVKNAAADPDYVKATLLSAYSFYIKKFFGGKFPAGDQIQNLIGSLNQHGNHFAITTSDPEVMSQARELNPVQTLNAPILYDAHLPALPGTDPQFPGRYRTGYSFLFTVKQISDLIAANPDYFQKYCQDAIHPGTRRSHYLLNSNDSF